MFGEQSFDEMGTVGFMFEVVNKDDTPFFQQALGERTKVAIQAAGKDGTLQRFLARQQRQRSGRQQLTMYDRTGQIVSRVGEPGSFFQPTLSPDGSRVAVIKNDIETDTQDVWVFDVATGKGHAVTADLDSDSAPVWSPDGKDLAYVSVRNNTNGIYRRAADGTGAEETLYQHPTGAPIVLTDWSVDGRYLGFWINDAMFVLPLTGERKLVALNQDEFFGRGGRLSPDSRLLAYNSNSRQGLRFQVYVRPFDPSTGAQGEGPAQKVSADNGNGMGVSWRRDGKELFYLTQGPAPSVVMAVEVSGSSPFTASAPRPLFTLPHPVPNPAQLSQISSANGDRFVFAVNLPQRQVAAK
jgi:TolB protein